MNIQDWFPLGLIGLTSCCQRDSQEASLTPQFQSINSLMFRPLYGPTLTSSMTNRKIIALTIQTFVGKVRSLLFNILSRFVIAFLPRSKHLLISWLQSPYAVILEPKKIKPVIVFIVSPSICHEVTGLEAMIFVFWMLSFKPAFSLSSFTFIKRPFSSSSPFALRVVSFAHLRFLIFLLAILFPLLQTTLHFAWCTLHKN